MADRAVLVRGMRDLRDVEIASITLVERTFADVLTSYGYEYIRLPTIEQTQLFSRGLGEATDAVSKEMFSFDDDAGSLSLRPEGTASCVRAVIDGNMYRGNTPKLWYAGSMFRRERPQRGRYREFYQVGGEAFGLPGPDVDAEMVRLVQDVWERLGVAHSITLEINTLGNLASRKKYRERLVEFLAPRRAELDADSQRRLELNPLRVLDSKDERTQQVLTDAPDIMECLDDESLQHFDELRARISRLGVDAHVNPKLVRGLDYYTHGVFEWNTDKLGAQKQVGGGGRYDGLCELLGGAACPATGFAMGVDRVALLMQQEGLAASQTAPDVYVVALSNAEEDYAIQVAQRLRDESELRVRTHQGGGKVKARMRAADRSKADIALIIGAQEAAAGHVSIKWLRTNRDQATVPLPDLHATLLNND